MVAMKVAGGALVLVRAEDVAPGDIVIPVFGWEEVLATGEGPESAV